MHCRHSNLWDDSIIRLHHLKLRPALQGLQEDWSHTSKLTDCAKADIYLATCWPPTCLKS